MNSEDGLPIIPDDLLDAEADRPELLERTAWHIEEIFRNHGDELAAVRDLARRVKNVLNSLDPFIQMNSALVCRQCREVCCINKHGYYNCDDLIYIHALGLKPHTYDCRDDTDPCQFLSPQGCVLDRTVRPSGCNWYFCDRLYDHMEKAPGTAYRDFENSFQELADLWIALMQEFRGKFRKIRGCEMQMADLVRNSHRGPRHFG